MWYIGYFYTAFNLITKQIKKYAVKLGQHVSFPGKPETREESAYIGKGYDILRHLGQNIENGKETTCSYTKSSVLTPNLNLSCVLVICC